MGPLQPMMMQMQIIPTIECTYFIKSGYSGVQFVRVFRCKLRKGTREGVREALRVRSPLGAAIPSKIHHAEGSTETMPPSASEIS